MTATSTKQLALIAYNEINVAAYATYSVAVADAWGCFRASTDADRWLVLDAARDAALAAYDATMIEPGKAYDAAMAAS
jgi:hypothetical protein